MHFNISIDEFILSSANEEESLEGEESHQRVVAELTSDARISLTEKQLILGQKL